MYSENHMQQAEIRLNNKLNRFHHAEQLTILCQVPLSIDTYPIPFKFKRVIQTDANSSLFHQIEKVCEGVNIPHKNT